MKRKINGQLGDWKVNTTIARPIEINIKCACLELFKQGSGYRMAANALGLKLYTVRDWARRFKLEMNRAPMDVWGIDCESGIVIG